MLKENEGKVEGIYVLNLIYDEVLVFIEDNKDISFFFYYFFVILYVELFVLVVYMEKYWGKYDLEKFYKGRDDGERYRLGFYGL